MKKFTVLVFALVLLVGATAAMAQVSVEFTPIFSKKTEYNSFLDKEFSTNGTLYEINGRVVSKGASLRGFHLFKSSYTAPSTILDDKGKEIPVTFDSNFSATRIELGLPLIHRKYMVEPFFVNSYTKNTINVATGKILYSNNAINNTQGLGIYYSQLITKNQNISAKYYLTPKDSLLDLNYNWFKPFYSLGLGYTFRTYDNIKINGPSLNILITF